MTAREPVVPAELRDPLTLLRDLAKPLPMAESGGWEARRERQGSRESTLRVTLRKLADDLDVADRHPDVAADFLTSSRPVNAPKQAAGTPRDREKAPRALLTLITEVAVVPMPASRDPFDFEQRRADIQAWYDRQRAIAIQVEGAAQYAADGDLSDIAVATAVLRGQASRELPYEPYQDREAGQ